MTQSTIYIIALAIAAVVLLGWLVRYLYRRGRAPRAPRDQRKPIAKLRDVLVNVGAKISNKTETERITLDGVYNVLLVDCRKHSWYPCHVELLPDKDYGRLWEYLQYNGLHYLQRSLDGTLTVLTPPQRMGDSPNELYEAVQTLDDVQEVFGWRDVGGNKSYLIPLLIAAGVALFIMFMAMTYEGKDSAPATALLPMLLSLRRSNDG